MLERVVRSALYSAAEAGYEQAARAVIARVDPLLRRSVNKRVQRAINDAIERTGPVDAVVDEQQQLRVAYLLHAGVLGELDPRSTEDVASAFAKAAATAPKKAPRLFFFTPLLLLLLFGGGGLFAFYVFGPSAEQRLRTSTLGRSVGVELTKWVVYLDRYRRARDGLRSVDDKLSKLKKQRETLLATTKEALGDEGEKAMGALLEAGERITGSGRPTGDDGEPRQDLPEDFVPDDEKTLYGATKAINELLAREGHPVLLDARTNLTAISSGGDLGGAVPFREVIILSYYVERRGHLRYRDESTELTLGKRLDTLNVDVADDAYDTNAIGGLLVSLDVPEEALATTLMKPLSGQSPWELVPEKEAQMMEGGKEMLDIAGQTLRDELLGSAAVQQESANRIALLLEQRRDAILKLTDLDVASPRRLLIDEDSLEKLEHFRKDNLEAFQVLELNEKLQGYEDDFKSVLLVFADAAAIRGSVYLLEKSSTAPTPEPLNKALSELPLAYRDPEHPRRALLADLAAIGHSPTLAKTLLSLLVQRMLRSSGRFLIPGPRVLLSELSDTLGVAPSDPWLERGAISKRFPALYKALMAKSSAEVQEAARETFERLAGTPPPELTWR